jgi:hypothetical protein
VTSNTSSWSGKVATAPICDKEEDVPATGSVVDVAPPAAVASTTEPVSETGMPASCATLTADPWEPPSFEAPCALDPWGEGVMFGFEALESRSRGQ